MEELFKAELENGIAKLKQLAQESLVTRRPATLEEMFRVAHTLKGACKLMDESDLTAFFHQLETEIDNCINGDTDFSRIIEMINSLENSNEMVSIPKKELNNAMEIVEELFLIANETSSKRIEKIAFRLQSFFLSCKLIPIYPMLQKIAESAYAIAADLNKVVHVSINCLDVRIDKILEGNLYGALLHITRNAIDHGIEEIFEREANGKKPVGEIVIEAKNVAGGCEIIVKDDGRGIDIERLRRKAEEAGFDPKISLLELIALPISAKDDVSEYSGRGVGVSAVVELVKAIGGKITVETEANKGTSFKIFVPIKHPFDKYLIYTRGPFFFAVPIYQVIKVTDSIDTVSSNIAVYEGIPKNMYDPLDINIGKAYIICDVVYVVDKIIGILSAYESDGIAVVKNVPAFILR